MSTIRVHKERNYSVISNTILSDKRLSWEARGMAAFILTKPNDWVMRVGHLVTQGPCGKDKVWRMLGELQACGYLTRSQVHNPDGTFRWEHVLYEEPQRREGVQPCTEKPCMVNPPIVNTDVSSNTDISSKGARKTRPHPIPEMMGLTPEREKRMRERGVNDPAVVFRNFHDFYMARRQVVLTDWDTELDRWSANQRPSPPSSAKPPSPHASAGVMSLMNRIRETTEQESRDETVGSPENTGDGQRSLVQTTNRRPNS